MTASPVDVSVLVPVLNEAALIERTTEAMRSQRFDGAVELLFVDGGSDDGTRAFLERLAAEDDSIRILDNPARRQAPALNLGLRQAGGEFVARMDAHTFYPPNYLSSGVERLRRGDVAWVGGPQLAQPADRGSRLVTLALTSPLGVGGAVFRRMPRGEIEADTAFTGLLRRTTLEKLGGWDERWSANEDGELAARVREAGGRIVCIPEMAARYVPRDRLRGLARQYWRYGWGRAMTCRRHPESMRRSHLLPPGLLLTAAAATLGRRTLARRARAGLLAYATCVAVESVRRAERPSDATLLPWVFATMHSAWGAGFVANCAREGVPLSALRESLTGGGRQPRPHPARVA
jgi:glycosyltransferase involved in cell wall biosynthesis